MVVMFLAAAKNRAFYYGEQKWAEAGVAIHVAFAGLFRMGELTSNNPDPFDPAEDLCERHLLFHPTFWTATHVTIQLGGTKADQPGERDRARPRMLPIDEPANSPGKNLRDMIARRHRLREGQEPTLSSAPVFQDGKGGHLTRDGVLAFIRSTLQRHGVAQELREKFGTHSARIGGATRLFQLGATGEEMQHPGGWA